jgi:hypothetical protein
MTQIARPARELRIWRGIFLMRAGLSSGWGTLSFGPQRAMNDHALADAERRSPHPFW